MNQSLLSQINEYEERLRRAMLTSDVAALDRLLSDDLHFTNHLGQVMSKQDDLEAHRSGLLKINSLTLSSPTTKIIDDVAAISVLAHIAGQYNGELSEGNFRFTRIWHRTTDDNWQVIVAHSSIVH